MKTYAIEIFFNDAFDRYVRDLWNQCNENHLSSFGTNIKGIEPHIALALYSNIDVDSLSKRFNEFIQTEISEFNLFFDAIAIFPTSNVTFFQPNTNQDLSNLMSKVHAFFSDFEENCNPYYSEQRWFPHVTVAYNGTYEELKSTFSYVVNNYESMNVRAQKIGLVEITYENNICVSCETLIAKRLMEV
ncbi:2'-5' RNA ligase family protein [Cohnella yongneupensis]|uniref:2'-5' RNA ligase family protein n=1 Tax=Cohnella yongneupensis TaxID=425006 RepID=A0ABW0QYV0_9BACL